jgi:hypothetical protein
MLVATDTNVIPLVFEVFGVFVPITPASNNCDVIFFVTLSFSRKVSSDGI